MSGIGIILGLLALPALFLAPLVMAWGSAHLLFAEHRPYGKRVLWRGVLWGGAVAAGVAVASALSTNPGSFERTWLTGFAFVSAFAVAGFVTAVRGWSRRAGPNAAS